jgi:hypothetical protein
VVALLAEVGRNQGNRELALRVEDPEPGVVAHVLGREALLREVRDQLGDRAGVHASPRQHVIADGRALLEHEHGGRLDRRLAALLGCAVPGRDLAHEVDRRRQRRGARPDVQDVDLHALALDLAHRILVWIGAFRRGGVINSTGAELTCPAAIPI